MREFVVSERDQGQKCVKYICRILPNAGTSFVYKMLRKKNITLNGKKTDGTECLKPGDTIRIFFAEETFLKFSGTDTQAEKKQGLTQAHALQKERILYEDVNILLYNKPAGLLSQKAEPDDVSVNEMFLAYLLQEGKLTQEQMATCTPSICNRLDRNTSGLLAAGKTLKGLQEMAKALKERSVQKYYRCIVKGTVKEASYLKGYLQKDESSNQVLIRRTKPSEGEWLPIETEYKPIRCMGGYTEFEVHLMTGRSHQIRAHLASIGHPIIGDYKYGDSGVNVYFKKNARITSQLLHASRFVFEDGREITAPCGAEFERAWNVIENL